MERTLIVARMAPNDGGAVAAAFARSDATELPGLLKVSRRTLFRFHDLYFHLVESAADIGSGLARLRDHPGYTALNTELKEYIRPYSPDWQGPRDAMAEAFYSWKPENG
jgi:cyclase